MKKKVSKKQILTGINRLMENFLKVLNKAKDACKNSGFNIDEQLVEVNRLSKRNNNATANIQDYKLSRYICYLIVQNADPSKEVVALGQTYFAVQTRI